MMWIRQINKSQAFNGFYSDLCLLTSWKHLNIHLLNEYTKNWCLTWTFMTWEWKMMFWGLVTSHGRTPFQGSTLQITSSHTIFIHEQPNGVSESAISSRFHTVFIKLSLLLWSKKDQKVLKSTKMAILYSETLFFQTLRCDSIFN